MSEFIQVGLTAIRDPITGEISQAVPLYIERKDEAAAGPLAIDATAFAREIARKFRGQMAEAREKENIR